MILCIESTICRPKSVPIKRAAKTIMLHSCDEEICEDTSETIVEKGETRRKDKHVAWPGRQMMLAKRIIHIYRVFLYTTFQRM